MTELRFDVVGAEGPRRYFEALAPAALAHAYAFTGPAGVGKKTFGRRLAQSLLCLAPKEGVVGYDGVCTSCALFAVDHARHPDFLEHEGVLKIGDRDVPMGFYESDQLSARDVVRQLSMQSYSGGMRVLLLGDVDFATQHAANALLKFLEDPPRGVVMILTTPAPGRLLSTIRSRLIEIRFPLLSKAQVGEVLRRLHYQEADADLGAALSGGSVRRAVAALEPQEESLRAAVARWFFESVDGKSPHESWATRETLAEGLETVKTLVRDWIVANGQDAATLISLDYAERLRGLPALRPRDAAAMLARLDEAQRLSRTNVSAGLVGEYVRMAITSSR